jgi:hypothetical protein
MQTRQAGGHDAAETTSSPISSARNLVEPEEAYRKSVDKPDLLKQFGAFKITYVPPEE